jgi:hypothetical protein
MPDALGMTYLLETDFFRKCAYIFNHTVPVLPVNMTTLIYHTTAAMHDRVVSSGAYSR